MKFKKTTIDSSQEYGVTSIQLLTIFSIMSAFLLLLQFNSLALILFFLTYILFLGVITGKYHSLILFSFGVVVAIITYHYWIEFYGSEYFLGRQSDDWQYDVLWAPGYIQDYGWSYINIVDHLNTIERGLGLSHNSKGYIFFISVLQFLSEQVDIYHTLIARITNIFFLVLTGFFAQKIYELICNDRKSWMVSVSISLYPVLLFNSVHVFRDTIIMFLMVYFVFILVKNKHKILRLRSAFILITCLAIMLTMRTASFLLLLGIMTIYFWIYIFSKRQKWILSLLVVSLISVILEQEIVKLVLSSVAKYTELNQNRFGSVGSKIFELPIEFGVIPRMLYLILTPVPNFSSLHQAITSMSAIIQFLSVPLLLSVISKAHGDIRFISYIFIMIFMGVALSTATFRHVMMYIPFGIILVKYELYKRHSFPTWGYSNQVILFSFFSAFILILLYI